MLQQRDRNAIRRADDDLNARLFYVDHSVTHDHHGCPCHSFMSGPANRRYLVHADDERRQPWD